MRFPSALFGGLCAAALVACVASSREADTTPPTPPGSGFSPPPPAASSGEGGAPDGGASSPDAAPSPRPPPGPRTVFTHLFEWKWNDIARECEDVLGPAGYAAVQISPPQEHAELPSHPWWERYQPVSYQLESRGGTRAELASMIARCKRAGVDIYVDAVLNHMSFVQQGVGSAGSTFSRKSYPGIYGPNHFHGCERPIQNWGSRDEIFHCELATLPDLDTAQEHVRTTLAAYLQDLVDLGVSGIRVDAAKHISPVDLSAILGKVRGPLYVYQEVLDDDGRGVVTSAEYQATGDVTEVRYGAELSRVLRAGKLAWLETFGPAWGLLPPTSGVAFIDNHDNQRGHGSGNPLTFKERPLYELGLIFMLAWPYGYPQIMSSYAFTDGNQGPPAEGPRSAGSTASTCAPGWICEHRWPSALGMVGFRNAADSAPSVTDFWTDGDQRIAFGRGARGFVVINRATTALRRSFRTSMAPGTYCDVVKGPKLINGACAGTAVSVRADGSFEAEVPALSAVAIHALAPAPTP
ncbi:MAG: alpha-amylase family protein [Myxococcales bacterium]|nr:alpha-amylase family protein [Myxococcales bacterium]